MLQKRGVHRNQREIAILDLGAGAMPEWLAGIASRHPKHLFEAVDKRMPRAGKGFPVNLHRKRGSAFKRLKQIPSKSTATVTMNLAEVDFFYRRFLRGMSRLKKADRAIVKGGLPHLKASELAENALRGFNLFPERFLLEVQRVLKPNGAFVVATTKSISILSVPQLEKYFNVKTIKLSKEMVMRSGTASMKAHLKQGLPKNASQFEKEFLRNMSQLVKLVCKQKS